MLTINVPAVPVIAVKANGAKVGGLVVSIKVKPLLVIAADAKALVVTAWLLAWA